MNKDNKNNSNGFSLKCLQYKITDNTTIIHMHPGTKSVENSSYSDINIFL